MCGETGYEGPVDSRIGTNYVVVLEDGRLHAGAVNGFADGFAPRNDHLSIIYNAENPRQNITQRLTRVWRDEVATGFVIRAEVRSARFMGDPSRTQFNCTWLLPYRRDARTRQGEEAEVWAVTRDSIPSNLRDNLERRFYGAPLEVIGKPFFITVPNEETREYTAVSISADAEVARLVLSSNQYIGAERPVVMAICMPFDEGRKSFAELYCGGPLVLESVDFR